MNTLSRDGIPTIFARAARKYTSSQKTNMFTGERRLTKSRRVNKRKLQGRRRVTRDFCRRKKKRAYFWRLRKDDWPINSRPRRRRGQRCVVVSVSHLDTSSEHRTRMMIPSADGDCWPRSKLVVTIALTTRRLSRTRDGRAINLHSGTLRISQRPQPTSLLLIRHKRRANSVALSAR